MNKWEDPNPLDDAGLKCGMRGCSGNVTISEDGEQYECDECDWTLDYDCMKEIALFTLHLEDQYPNVDLKNIDLEEFEDIMEEMDDEDDED